MKHVFICCIICALVGCASQPLPPPAAVEAAATEAPAAAAAAPPAATPAVDLESLLATVLRNLYFSMSLDYFMQFVWEEDYIFPDNLLQIFSLPAGPYQVGQQSVLVSSSPDGKTNDSLRVALLAQEENGSAWWQVEQQVPGQAIFYEVLVSREGVPLVIRYLNPEDGVYYQTVPLLAVEFERALEQMPREELAAKIREAGEQERGQWFGELFHDPRVVGEESVTVGAGSFPAVHVRDVLPGEQGADRVEIDYWLSPEVPGNILRISTKVSGQAGAYNLELAELNSGVAPVIGEEMVAASGDGEAPEAEGSPGEPILLLPGDYHRGRVAPEGTSYYRIDVKRRADISVEVSDLAGDAELFYYAEDASYTDWVSASSGWTLDFQHYYAEPGSSVYFSIVDYADDAGAGEFYSIQVLEDPLLARTGIMIRGDIYEQAVELSSGGRYRKSLGSDALAYYKTTVKAGPALRIEAENLPQGAALIWFDTLEGSYTSGMTEQGENRTTLTVRGLAAGTVCLYYVVGDQAAAAGASFNLSLKEFAD
jgi:hypothetical protein